ncbi:unnamed protein product [Urochloa humidicola]
MDSDGKAKAFVDHYYATFDTDRAAMEGLFQEGSMLTFEGETFVGAAAITAKLTSLQFSTCKHEVTAMDYQPSGPAGGMLVVVSGTMHFEVEPLLKFTQVFHFMPVEAGKFYVQNTFRLNYV